MPADKATDKPGKMGWGVDGWSWQQLISAEQRTLDEIGELVPDRLIRGEPKPPNLDLLKAVVEEQKSDGIEDGFSMLHLVKAINGGQTFPWIQQYIGSCVASGDMRTTAYRMIAEVFLLNDTEELPGIDIDGRDSIPFYAPYNYRAGRKIGGLNGGDGSYCSAHIKGKMQYGHLPCHTEGLSSDLFPEPRSESAYRKWGNSNQLLDQYAPVGKKYPLVSSEFVKQASDMRDIMTTMYAPANICSNWGFAPASQHPTWKLADGSPVWIYRRSGSWAHNMSIVAIVKVGGDWFVIVENSWGMNAHRNGSWFAITLELFDSWLNSAECATVGEIDMSDNPPVWPE